MNAVRLNSRIAVVATMMLAACQTDTPPETDGGRPDILAASRIECEADGGRWGPALSGAVFVCYRTTGDAGQSCSGSEDCETHCLARSRTCAPIEPFYGCHEVLSRGGVPATLCIQ